MLVVGLQISTRVQVRMSLDRADFLDPSFSLGYSSAITAGIIKSISEENTLESEAVAAVFAGELKERTVRALSLATNTTTPAAPTASTASTTTTTGAGGEESDGSGESGGGGGSSGNGSHYNSSGSGSAAASSLPMPVSAVSISAGRVGGGGGGSTRNHLSTGRNAQMHAIISAADPSHFMNPLHALGPGALQQQQNQATRPVAPVFTTPFTNMINEHKSSTRFDASNDSNEASAAAAAAAAAAASIPFPRTATTATERSEGEESVRSFATALSSAPAATAGCGGRGGSVKSSSSAATAAVDVNASPRLLSITEHMPEAAVQSAVQALMFDAGTSEGNTRKLFIDRFKSGCIASIAAAAPSLRHSFSLQSVRHSIAARFTGGRPSVNGSRARGLSSAGGASAATVTLLEVRHFIDGMHEYILGHRGVSLALLFEREKQKHIILAAAASSSSPSGASIVGGSSRCGDAAADADADADADAEVSVVASSAGPNGRDDEGGAAVPRGAPQQIGSPGGGRGLARSKSTGQSRLGGRAVGGIGIGGIGGGNNPAHGLLASTMPSSDSELTSRSSLQFLKDNNMDLSMIDEKIVVFISFVIFMVVEESIFLPLKADIIGLLPSSSRMVGWICFLFQIIVSIICSDYIKLFVWLVVCLFGFCAFVRRRSSCWWRR
jgi:trimeric autotransporter adhesin